MIAQPPPEGRDAYGYHHTMTTRWHDNDVYAHMNNVVYYEYFDTIVNHWLIEIGVLDFRAGTIIGLVAETQCRYITPIRFPDQITAGLRLARIGRSSLVYEIALFRNQENAAAAQGRYVHVYVGRHDHRPTPMPERLRIAASRLLRKQD